ncbi:peptide chain release factor N(5)-glutamine methyltransferase [Flavobacterium turcicum]|uniref:Release factor glutamine methyltransferase n=1 Tax=Flavobacterium turcicum TaxID=2764718 RepID=A0ABR7JIY0_9FLAO|nr:peptide chain release factor N(5)-glutamine methyltransferase [Flavobacterium turcicum]MBC5864452.1 peptide chain release factor N(5)-glutamine methyltransferase [Flavobacterium turcicum]NHL03220.1 peptide chain release factor N(5)-glutamine methyltransferase [Flavobacterium turcicum]
MKIRDYRAYFIQESTPICSAEEAESFFYIILEDLQQLKRVDLALNPDLSLSEEQLNKWNAYLSQLKLEIPVQYVLGKTNFFGLDFEVNPAVLIPRPETEELVDWIIESQKETSKDQNLRIIDIGTGSGCIAISLAKNIPNAQVTALDVSVDALATAQKNAQNNKVDVVFKNQNILETNDLQEQFDVIVSNPPYIRNLEKVEIKKNVLDYEPHLALFVENDNALIFYKKIAELAQKNLKPNGFLFFEINQYLGPEMIGMLQGLGFKNIILKKDIYGNDRMIRSTY